MRLQDLIETLAEMPSGAAVLMDCGTVPTRFCSWRGVYGQLTLDNEAKADPITCRDLLELARKAVGKSFYGYKGGEYTMTADTPVWADPYGEYWGRMLLGAVLSGDTVVLRTMVRPEEYL